MVWNILGITPGDSQGNHRRENFCFLGLGDCGGHQSTTVNNKINNDVNLQATISTSLNKTAKNNINAQNILSAKIIIGSLNACCGPCSPAVKDTYIKSIAGKDLCKNVTIEQTSSTHVSVYSKLDSKTFSEMSAKLESTISTIIDTDINQLSQEDVNALANILSENNKRADIASNIKTSISEAIKQSFTENLVNSIIINTLSTQDGQLVICFPIAGNCTIKQDDIQNIQAANVLNSVANIVQSASAIAKISEAVKSGVTQEDKGILGALAAIFKSLGVVVVGAIIAGVLLIILLIVILIVAKSGKKSGARLMFAPSTTTTR